MPFGMVFLRPLGPHDQRHRTCIPAPGGELSGGRHPAVSATEWAPGGCTWPSGLLTANADWSGQDLTERISEGSARVVRPGLVAPGDEPVGAHQDRAVATDLAVTQPGAAWVIQVTVEVADPQRVECQARFGGELVGCFAPSSEEPRPSRQLHPRRLHGIRHLDWIVPMSGVRNRLPRSARRGPARTAHAAVAACRELW
jgi:hypothetical protein